MFINILWVVAYIFKTFRKNSCLNVFKISTTQKPMNGCSDENVLSSVPVCDGQMEELGKFEWDSSQRICARQRENKEEKRQGR